MQSPVITGDNGSHWIACFLKMARNVEETGFAICNVSFVIKISNSSHAYAMGAEKFRVSDMIGRETWKNFGSKFVRPSSVDK